VSRRLAPLAVDVEPLRSRPAPKLTLLVWFESAVRQEECASPASPPSPPFPGGLALCQERRSERLRRKRASASPPSSPRLSLTPAPYLLLGVHLLPALGELLLHLVLHRFLLRVKVTRRLPQRQQVAPHRRLARRVLARLRRLLLLRLLDPVLLRLRPLPTPAPSHSGGKQSASWRGGTRTVGLQPLQNHAASASSRTNPTIHQVAHSITPLALPLTRLRMSLSFSGSSKPSQPFSLSVRSGQYLRCTHASSLKTQVGRGNAAAVLAFGSASLTFRSTSCVRWWLARGP
jgi:hypothetical protein